MTVRLRRCGAWITLAGIASLARAELHWEKAELEITPSSTDSVAPAEFRFTNTGSEAVKILEVRPDCGCVLSAPNTTIYAPGASGAISLVFKIEGQWERRDVPITVTTASGSETTHTILVLHVRVQEAVHFSEKFVYWRASQPLESRTIYITVKPSDRITVQSATSDSPDFHVALSRTSDPDKYALRVTPPPEHGRAFANILVTTTSAADPNPREQRLIARVW